MPSIRIATTGDAPEIAAIYAPVVRDTVISFEVEPPGAEEFAKRISGLLPAYPWLVAEEADRVIGYAYAGPHRARAAYRWSVEPSVYIAEEARGRGVARALYERLFTILRAQGFANAYAGVTLPNEPSVRLHRSFGFMDVGVYGRVGYKYGQWHDVWWGALDLAPDRDGTPSPPLTLNDLKNSDLFSFV